MAETTQTPEAQPETPTSSLDAEMLRLLANNTTQIAQSQALVHQMVLGLTKEMCPSAFNMDKKDAP